MYKINLKPSEYRGPKSSRIGFMKYPEIPTTINKRMKRTVFMTILWGIPLSYMRYNGYRFYTNRMESPCDHPWAEAYPHILLILFISFPSAFLAEIKSCDLRLGDLGTISFKLGYLFSFNSTLIIFLFSVVIVSLGLSSSNEGI